MPVGDETLGRLGGACLVTSALLFVATGAIELAMGLPPATGEQILAWMARNETLLAVNVEVRFFAVMALAPAVLALHRSLQRAHPASAAVGCGLIAVTIPMLAMLVVLEGRLVYPVQHIRVHTAEVAELVVSLYYGGVHAVVLIAAAATGVLSGAMRSGRYGRGLALVGVASVIAEIAAGYPEAIGARAYFACGLVGCAWMVLAGARLWNGAASVRGADLDEARVPVRG